MWCAFTSAMEFKVMHSPLNHNDVLQTLDLNNLDVAGQRKTIVRKAAQFITQPLFLFFTKVQYYVNKRNLSKFCIWCELLLLRLFVSCFFLILRLSAVFLVLTGCLWCFSPWMFSRHTFYIYSCATFLSFFIPPYFT